MRPSSLSPISLRPANSNGECISSPWQAVRSPCLCRQRCCLLERYIAGVITRAGQCSALGDDGLVDVDASRGETVADLATIGLFAGQTAGEIGGPGSRPASRQRSDNARAAASTASEGSTRRRSRRRSTVIHTWRSCRITVGAPPPTNQRYASAARAMGSGLKLIQSGNIRSYAAWVVFGSIILIIAIGLMGAAR